MTSPDLSLILSEAIRYHLAEVNTCIPARIVEYDADEQRASVQPLIRRQYKDNVTESRAVIQDVPVIFPAAGGGIISFPVKVGDTVLCLFSQRSIDRWVRSTGGEVVPGDNRKHDISDAMAIPGLFPFSEALSGDSENVIIKFGGAEIELSPSGNITLRSGSTVTIEANDTQVNGDLTVSGTVEGTTVRTAAGIDLGTHTHSGVTTGGGVSGPPVP